LAGRQIAARERYRRLLRCCLDQVWWAAAGNRRLRGTLFPSLAEAGCIRIARLGLWSCNCQTSVAASGRCPDLRAGSRTRTRDLAQTLELAATAAERSSHEEMTQDLRSHLHDLSETVELGETTLAARAQTRDDYSKLAAASGLKTFERMREVSSRQYEDTARLHNSRARLIAAFGKRPGA
jgi:hypothetical protein